MAGEAQVVETLRVFEGAGLAQCRHQPAVVVLRGHAGQQQSLCVGGALGEGSKLHPPPAGTGSLPLG